MTYSRPLHILNSVTCMDTSDLTDMYARAQGQGYTYQANHKYRVRVGNVRQWELRDN